MFLRTVTVAAALLSGSAISAEAHGRWSNGCRAYIERHGDHGHYREVGCYYAKQLPRRYAISPAQNFEAWNYTSRGGIRRFSTGCGGETFWDGSQCRRWTVAADGTPLAP